MAEEKPLKEKTVTVADPCPLGSMPTSGGETEIAKSCGLVWGVTISSNA
jgi:hypothetical protein